MPGWRSLTRWLSDVLIDVSSPASKVKYRSSAMRPKSTTITTANESVSRIRTGSLPIRAPTSARARSTRRRASATALIDVQPVAGPAYGFEHLRAERPVELVAQVADVYVDHVRAVLVALIPDVLEQLEAAEHLARPAHEDLEQRELARRQRELARTVPGAPAR